MTRTDTHKPSLLDPSEYRYLGCFYQGSSDAMAKSYGQDEVELSREIRNAGSTPFAGGNYETKMTCDHCGAVFAHGVVFLHVPSNEHISVGHICASDTIGLPSRAAATKRSAEKAAAAAAEQAKRFEQGQAWRNENTDVVEFLALVEKNESDYREAMGAANESNSPLPEAPATSHPFLTDMVHNLAKWGTLFPKQADAVRKFAANAESFAARKAERQAADAADAPTTPLAEGRLALTGTIVHTKWQDSDYGSTPKMLVKLADGNKVWGTVPEALFANDETTDSLRGREVEFTGTVKRSDNDEHFGFFSRPAKATIKEAN